MRSKKSLETKCAICGKIIVYYPARPRVTCGTECKRIYNGQARRVRNVPKHYSVKFASVPLSEQEKKWFKAMEDQQYKRPRTNCAGCQLMSKKDENSQLICGKVVADHRSGAVKWTNVPDERCTFKWGDQ